jgi:hypothetical protein
MSAEVVSFMEESCWNKNQRRPARQPVMFRITSIGRIQGFRLDKTFVSDFGLFYDPDDLMIMSVLSSEMPGIVWGQYVYWREYDRGQIKIIDTLTDQVVGSITVRKRIGGDPAGEIDWTNVVCPIREYRG